MREQKTPITIDSRHVALVAWALLHVAALIIWGTP